MWKEEEKNNKQNVTNMKCDKLNSVTENKTLQHIKCNKRKNIKKNKCAIFCDRMKYDKI